MDYQFLERLHKAMESPNEFGRLTSLEPLLIPEAKGNAEKVQFD